MIKKREVARKLLHLSLVFSIISDIYLSHILTVLSIFVLSFLYLFGELLRRNGRRLPIITELINYCCYPYEKESFLLPPFLLLFSLGLLLSIFERKVAYVGIVASTLGDVSAWFFGKLFGKVKLPYSKRKTLEGFLACFFVTLSGSLIFLDFTKSFLVSMVVSFTESISEKIDNFTVPFSVGLVRFLL